MAKALHRRALRSNSKGRSSDIESSVHKKAVRAVRVGVIVVGLALAGLGGAGALGLFNPSPGPNLAPFNLTIAASTNSRPTITPSNGFTLKQHPKSNSVFQPVLIKIPSMDIQVPLIPETDPSGSLIIPSNLNQWAWWTGGASPGSSVGAVLLAGHDDSAIYGNGPAKKLWGLKQGTLAYVYGPSGQSIAYSATSLTVLLKTSLAKYANDLYSPAGSPKLVIVTCGGTFNPSTGHWDSNVIATFSPVA